MLSAIRLRTRVDGAGRRGLAAARLTRRLRKRGRRIRHAREVRRARPRVELGEQRVVERRALAPVDLALRIREIAEDDRARRARGLAGGDDLAVAQLAPVD